MEIGKVGAEVGLSPLEEDHFGSSTPRKTVGTVEVEEKLCHIAHGGCFVPLGVFFCAAGSAKKFNSFEKDE